MRRREFDERVLSRLPSSDPIKGPSIDSVHKYVSARAGLRGAAVRKRSSRGPFTNLRIPPIVACSYNEARSDFHTALPFIASSGMSLPFRSLCLRLRRGLESHVAPLPALPLAAAGIPCAMAAGRSSGAGQVRGLCSVSPGQGSPESASDSEAQAQGRVLSFLALFRDFEVIGVPSSAGAVPLGGAAPATGLKAGGGQGAFHLRRMEDLVQALGRPLDDYQVVHVAGHQGQGHHGLLPGLHPPRCWPSDGAVYQVLLDPARTLLGHGLNILLEPSTW